MNKNIIVSVESRKGGVGKTTAALCVSKSLLEKGYTVLLIDTDITGTNITDCADSPFWHGSLNILTDSDSEKKEKVKANLLSLFENKFMNGDKVPSFQNRGKREFFYIDEKKINIIGSQVYSSDGSPSTICRPEILFDKLHGYWFVDFLKGLSDDFVTASKSKQVAIVLDNSPGYVGIAPAIQDWLTDIGPEVGKFLMVTSLDSQDMKSCAMAISVLHKRYREKWNTSRMFLKAKDENCEDLDYSLMTREFFLKLIEFEESVDNKRTREPFAFYNDPNVSGDEYSKHPEKYLGVIVNRVPKTVLKHRRTFRPNLNNNYSTFLELLGGSYSRDWSKHMVGYDPYIEYQFSQSGISRKRYSSKWNRDLNKIITQTADMNYEKLYFPTNDLSEIFERINNYVNDLQNVIDSTIDIMRTSGLDYLVDLIDEDWQPKKIVPNLQTSFYNFTAIADYLDFREKYWGKVEDDGMIGNVRLSVLESFMHEVDESFKGIDIYPRLKMSIVYLIASLPFPIGERRPPERKILDYFRGIIIIEKWFLSEMDCKRYHDLPRFLSTEIKNKFNYKKLMNKIDELDMRYFDHSDKEFYEFIYAFTSAQARIMSLIEDTQFLIWLIKTMIELENKQPNALPYVRKIAEDVIIHKTMSYDDVKYKSTSALTEAQYFADFDKAIKNIINCWRLTV